METPTAVNEESDRDRLTTRLEKQASRLEGQRRESFVDNKSLCTSCKCATITRIASKNNHRIKCGDMNEDVPDNITECSAYQSILTLSLSQMVEMATLIDNRSERPSGYM